MNIPKGITRAQHAKLKNDILDLAADTGCKICCYIVPHGIASGQKLEDRLKFGTNTLLMKFDQFLEENGHVAGMAHFDHTTDYKQTEYFRSMFAEGVPVRGGNKPNHSLRHVVSIDNTTIGHSHLVSVTDIVVGAFRFVANEPDKDLVGSTLLKKLAKIMWGRADAKGERNVRERGLCIRPKNIQHPDYKADIEALIARLIKYDKSA